MNWLKVIGGIAAGAGAVYTALKATKVWDNYLFPTKCKLGVLGMDQSGKTSWYNYLRTGKPGNPEQTRTEDPVKSFEIGVPGGKLTIKDGKDIQGGKDGVIAYYRPMVSDNNIILFTFNSKKFYSDESYRMQVMGRIGFICEEIGSASDKQFFIIPTFKDQLLEAGIDPGELKDLLYKCLREDRLTRPYASTEHIAPVVYQTNIESDLKMMKEFVFQKYKKS